MKQQLDHDEVSLHIEASAEALYDIVSDVTRTPELSPEVLKCTWLDGATGPAVGARFEATNKAGRSPAWKNRPEVIVADRGREFTISRTEKAAGTIVWRYRFEPQGSGTLVTESYEVIEPITAMGWFVIGTLYGNHDRRAGLRQGMTQTLERLREVAERSTTGG